MKHHLTDDYVIAFIAGQSENRPVHMDQCDSQDPIGSVYVHLIQSLGHADPFVTGGLDAWEFPLRQESDLIASLARPLQSYFDQHLLGLMTYREVKASVRQMFRECA